MRALVGTAVIAASLLGSPNPATAAPPDELAGLVGALLAKNSTGDWRAIEKLRGVRWAPLPPNMLQNCLPDGGCFTRDGVADVGGRQLAVVASGARTMVGNVYLRNPGAPLGEAAVLEALQRAGLRSELKRCPVPGGATRMNWYRLSGARIEPGYLSVQTLCNGRPCEQFAVYAGPDLQPLQPNQLRLFSEQCSGPAAARQPVATVMPHEQLAQLLLALMPAAGGPALPDWKALAAAPTGIRWKGEGPRKADLSFKNDPNAWMREADIAFSGRQFNLLFSGSPTQVKTAYFDEGGLHPRGEDLLGALRAKGLAVQLVRCGPVYTESVNNWYRVSGAATRPVMLRQSLRLDGRQVQDTYQMRLDATLPAREPRDRDPGVAGCK